ncbi:hypothetical protein [Geminisphaera colitermitum]|uniref:hypothetical protein n=1 Tax=Geminisphaera colitermitum TaxID=1148786 RepID=UPI000158CAA8|nr:hypothetical protein [Geminisphaera colitermitum]
MKPPDLLDPETLPDDLRWIAADFRLHPRDPVFQLIVWHWQRIENGEDRLRAASLELQAAIDSRLEQAGKAAESADVLTGHLVALRTLLDARPALVSEQLGEELRAPLAAFRAQEQAMAAVVVRAEATLGRFRRRETVATLVVGLGLGFVAALILGLAGPGY